MSVMVNGMNMPESCLSCPFQEWDGEDTVCYFTGISALNIGRQGACPINEGYDVGYLAGRRDSEQKWIPVEEQLPGWGEDVLISFSGFCDVGHIVQTNDEKQYNWFYSGWYHDPHDVDAWMSLPKPPKEE